MAIRSFRERAIQTLAYEVGGLCIAAPAFHLLFGAGAAESFVLIAALSVAVVVWSAVHNTAFDWIEFRTMGRLASDRPHGARLLHAVSLELTSIVATLPLVLALTPFSFIEALALDIGLTIFYAGYAYVFHLAFDHLRPVTPG